MRPLIKITPPPSAKDRRIKTYNFVDAARKLPCNWPESDVVPILRRINPDLMGQIRTLFIVLSDDQFRKVLSTLKRPQTDKARPDQPPPSGDTADDAMSVSSEVSAVSARSEQSSRSRTNNKRGASSSAGCPSAKK